MAYLDNMFAVYLAGYCAINYLLLVFSLQLLGLLMYV